MDLKKGNKADSLRAVLQGADLAAQQEPFHQQPEQQEQQQHWAQQHIHTLHLPPRAQLQQQLWPQQQQQQQGRLQAQPPPLQQAGDCLSPRSQLGSNTTARSDSTYGSGAVSTSPSQGDNCSSTRSSQTGPTGPTDDPDGSSSAAQPAAPSQQQPCAPAEQAAVRSPSSSNVPAMLQEQLPGVTTALTGLTGSTSSPRRCASCSPAAAAVHDPAPAAAVAVGMGAAVMRSPKSRQASFNSIPSPTGDVYSSAAGTFGTVGPLDAQSTELVVQLGVSDASIARLFRADAETEFEQPVWMVINLEGKIKGSYTADKMVEFTRRGTLGGAQLVLGMDRNLPYHARQELSYYRPLSQLVIGVHHGARYCPLTEDTVTKLAQQGLAATQWQPLVAGGDVAAGGGAGGADHLATELQQGVDLEAPTQAAAAMAASSRRVTAMAAAAQLRSVLKRLCCGSGGRMPAGGRPTGPGQTPVWLYINHLGWCRGPFSGGKVIQAHMCGRLPHDTLVVGLEPDVPPALISNGVEFWFRPLKDLIHQVAAGFSYNPVSFTDVAAYQLQQQTGQGSGVPQWQPLTYRDTGNPAPFQGGPQSALSNTAGSPGAVLAAAAAAANSGTESPDMSRAGSLNTALHARQDQGAAAAAAAAVTAAAAAAASSMLLQLSASSAMPAHAMGSCTDATAGLRPTSQALLMQALLQPQQCMLTPQQGPDATAATAAAATAQGQTYAVSYPYYVMPGAAGFTSHALPINPMGLLPLSAGLSAQCAPTQQAMLQGPSAMLGIAGMQLTPDAYPGMYPVMTGTASAGQQQQQQLWGQQVHSMPQGVQFLWPEAAPY